LHSIHAITHTEGTKPTGNEACYVKMLRCAIEPEKWTWKAKYGKFRCASLFFSGAEAPAPMW